MASEVIVIVDDPWRDFALTRKAVRPDPRQPLTAQQETIYVEASKGVKPKQIAAEQEIPLASVYDALQKARVKGWLVPNSRKRRI